MSGPLTPKEVAEYEAALSAIVEADPLAEMLVEREPDGSSAAVQSALTERLVALAVRRALDDTAEARETAVIDVLAEIAAVQYTEDRIAVESRIVDPFLTRLAWESRISKIIDELPKGLQDAYDDYGLER